MNFLHYKVVSARPRDRIRVYLKGNAANVLVMDDLNFANYRQGLQYDYYGGYYAVSPVDHYTRPLWELECGRQSGWAAR